MYITFPIYVVYYIPYLCWSLKKRTAVAKIRRMSYLELFITFAKIGVMMFGGGLAMLPLLQRELVENKKWVSEEEILDYYAIGQCTPGIIAVNCATFVGQKRKGILGGIIATLGVVFPSLVIITVIAAFLQGYADVPQVKNAFSAIRICVCVLILNSVVKLCKKTVSDAPAAIIFVLVAAGSLFLSVSPVIFVVLSGICGVVIKSLGAGK